MDLYDVGFSAILGPLAQAAGSPVSLVPDLLGAHVTVGGLTVAHLVQGIDGIHAYGESGIALGSLHEAMGHIHVVDGLGVPAFDVSAVGAHDAIFHDSLGHVFGGAHEGAFGVTQFHDAAGIAGVEMHHGLADLHGGLADLHHGIADMHGGLQDLHGTFADLHQGASDLMDLHSHVLDSLHDVDFGSIADHLHTMIDPGIFF